MRLSIILPSLNVAKYIEECLQSVITQAIKDVEIICIDAGSTDGTLEIIEQFAARDDRIRVIHSDIKSYGYQMNLGIKAAKGEYIGIVETDDFVTPGMFTTLCKIAEETNADFIKSGYVEFFEHKSQRMCLKVTNKVTDLVNGHVLDLSKQVEYRLADINHIWSGIYRREFLLSKGLWFNETPGASFQDTSFSILVGLTAAACVYTSDCFYHYRTDRMESSVKCDSKYRCVIDEFTYVENYLKKNHLSTEENERLVQTTKLRIYRWNMLRLSDKSRTLFRQEIVGEMEDVLSSPDCSDEEKENALFLLSSKEISIYEKQQEIDKQRFLEVIRRARKSNGYVVVGAGKYFEKLLIVQLMRQEKIIEAVCDNDCSIQNTYREQYLVLSVEEAVRNYRNSQWLITNKRYSEEIKKQLIELGISDDHIVSIDGIPDLITMYDELCQ